MSEALHAATGRPDPEFEERRRALEEMSLPRVCTHDETLEARRRAGAPAFKLRPEPCGRCGEQVRRGRELRARDVPGLLHALVFFILSWTLYLAGPYPPLRAEVAMWTTWLVCFALAYALRTPFRSARNALLILFTISWLNFILRYWSVITLHYLLTHSLHKWADCVFATTPIFFSIAIHALIDRLRARAAERDEAAPY
ncbi:MAG TPA: hypothetical protein VGX48_16765 [Pyrinomonadaceae bacterium]|jgi:hypothetical protein|nr:hypothetical protein [Pyrinomonadaceae bacterium]